MCCGSWVELNVEGATQLLETNCLQDMLHLERRGITVMCVLKESGKLEDADRAEDLAGLVT